MVHRLDVVAVRIQHKRGVVAGVIVPLPRGAVVTPSRRQSGGIEGLHLIAAGSLEGEMNARHGPLSLVDPKLVDREPVRRLATIGEAKSRKRGAVEALGSLKI